MNSKMSSFKKACKKIGASFLLASLIFTPFSGFAAPGGGGGGGVTCAFTGAVDTDWAVAGNWDCGHVPTSADTATIASGQSPQVGSAVSNVTSIQIASGATLTVSSGSVTATATLTNAGSFNVMGGTATVYMLTNSGSISANGGALNVTFSLTNQVGGTIMGMMAGTIDTLTLANAGAITHSSFRLVVGAGGFTNTGTYSADSTGTIAFSNTPSIQDLLYPSIELDDSITLANNSYLRSAGDITIMNGAVIVSNSSTFILPGSWEVESGGTLTGYGSTVQFTGGSTSTITVPESGANFYNIEVNKDTDDVGVMLLSHATATRALALTRGIFDLNSYSLNLPSSCTFTQGGGTSAWELEANWSCAGVSRLPDSMDFVSIPSPRTVAIAAAGPMDPSMSAGSLTISSGATLQLAGELSISGTSTNAGTISFSEGTLNLQGGSLATSTNNGTITSVSAGALNVDAPLVNEGDFDFSVGGVMVLAYPLSGGGTLNLSGASLTLNERAYLLPITSPILNLTIDSNLTTGVAYLQADTTITGTLTLDSFIELQGNTLTMSGSADIVSASNAGDFYSNNGILQFTGIGDQTITAPWTFEYDTFGLPAVVVNKASGSVLQSLDYASFDGNMTITAGTYNLGTGSFVDGSGTSLTIASGGVVTSTESSVINIPSASITNSGTLSVQGTANLLDLTNNGTVLLGAGGSAGLTVNGTFTNNQNFTGHSGGGTLTLKGDGNTFVKGGVSTFTAPQSVTFQGPTDMPTYSYNDVTLDGNIDLIDEATMTFGDVLVQTGAWTVQSMGSTQNALSLQMDSLTVDVGTSISFGGDDAGPTVTSTGALVNAGTITADSLLLNVGGVFTNSGTFSPTYTHLRFFGGMSNDIPATTYDQLSLVGSGTYTLTASTTVMATTTVATDATLALSTWRLNAIGDIVNTGLITSTGGDFHHPIDYVRFTDGSGTQAASLTDSDSLYITLKDQSRNLDGASADTISITVTSTVAAGAESETLTLTETTASSGIFRNASALAIDRATIVNENGTFEASASGYMQTTYEDNLDSGDSSSTAVTLTLAPVSTPSSGSSSSGSSSGGGGASAGSGSSAGIGVPTTFSFMPSTTPLPSSSPIIPPVSSDPTTSPIIPLPPTPPSPGSSRDLFLETGTTPASTRLGLGERRAIFADLRETLGEDRITLRALEQVANGEIPSDRNLARERTQLLRARATFRAIYSHDPDFRNPEENLAWNTLMYRIRFPRDLSAEREGIAEFRRTFRREPRDPFQWATVRVLGYVER